jgi:hypothetical protein
MSIWSAILKAVNSDLNTPLNTQLNNTETRLNTKLTNIDTAVNSRAPSSTALNTSTWTNARAGYLDNLSRAPFSAGSMVKSVQRGTSSLNGQSAPERSIGISAINPAKAIVILNGDGWLDGNNDGGDWLNSMYVSSVGATSISVATARYGPNATLTFSWQVIEFY